MVKQQIDIEGLALMIQQKEQQEEREIVERYKANMAIKKAAGNPFPVEALPTRLGNIARTFNTCYGLPVDYFGLGMLTAASVAIGNSYAIQYKNHQTFVPILYGAIVGNSSVGKTPAINLCLGPIFALEEHYRDQYDVRMDQWKQECFELQISGMRREDPPKPTQEELIINDATTEAINTALANNPKGVVMVRDELNGWINSLNQYRKGSDVEFWLSVWSNQSTKVNRVGKDSLYVRKPFVSVIGGIQPAVLNGFAQDGRQDNGFLARILFAWPDEMIKPYETDNQPDPSVFQAYRDIIHDLRKLPSQVNEEGFGDSIYTQLSDSARKVYKSWAKDNTDLINREDNDIMKSIYGKMENYLLRLALIISLVELVQDGGGDYTLEDMAAHQITSEDIERSIALIGYFKKTALKVIGNLESPVKKLSHEKESYYESLPEEFSTSTAVEAGKKLNIPERTVKRLLNDFTLFKQLGRGKYRRIWI